MNDKDMRAEFEALYSVPPMTQWSEKHGEYISALESVRDEARTYTSMFFAYCIGRQKAARAQSAKPVAWRDVMRELVDAMRRYEMDVDDAPPHDHRRMMERAEALLSYPPAREQVKPQLDWIACSERLPTEADAEPYSRLIGWDSEHEESVLCFRHEVAERPYMTHWKPTCLQRPEPPEE